MLQLLIIAIVNVLVNLLILLCQVNLLILSMPKDPF